MARLAAILLLAAAGCAAPSARGPSGLRAGAFAMDVTPERFPISVNGGMSDRTATSAHDRLHARCLVLDDGRTALAIAVVDSCMIPREIVDAARARAEAATGIPAAHMLVSATHTHTAPTAGPAFQSDPDPDYVAFLARRIAEGIAEAARRRAPAELGWAVGRDPGHLFNRRWLLKEGIVYEDPFGKKRDRVKMNPGYNNPDLHRPAGPVDPEVPVLGVRRPDGTPVAALVNYGLHYVGGVPALSADYFGMFADRFARRVGQEGGNGPFVAILSNGTSGDVNNVNYAGKPPGNRAPGEQAARVAEDLAAAVHEAWKGIAWRSDVTLASAQEEIELGVRKPSEAEVREARDLLAAAAGRPLKGLREIYARETVQLADYPATVRMRLQALRIGGLGVAAIPCEVFTEIGLEIRRRSPLRPAFTIELANGYNGYLPTPAQHELGGYETWRAKSSYLETGASPRIVETIVRLLGAVR